VTAVVAIVRRMHDRHSADASGDVLISPSSTSGNRAVPRPDRRQVLVGGALVAAVWATPTVLSFDAVALASGVCAPIDMGYVAGTNLNGWNLSNHTGMHATGGSSAVQNYGPSSALSMFAVIEDPSVPVTTALVTYDKTIPLKAAHPYTFSFQSYGRNVNQYSLQLDVQIQPPSGVFATQLSMTTTNVPQVAGQLVIPDAGAAQNRSFTYTPLVTGSHVYRLRFTFSDPGNAGGNPIGGTGNTGNKLGDDIGVTAPIVACV
jgi:hypothetical protein